MIIQEIRLKNFKCFEESSLKFREDVNVIVGNNGYGKTSVLEAIAVSIGGFLSGFEGNKFNRDIKSEEVRLKSFEIGNALDIQPQYPTIVSCKCVIQNREIKWVRELRTLKGRTTRIGAKEVIDYGKQLQFKIRSGDTSVNLPLLSYYGTGRLWLQKKKKKNADKIAFTNRFAGYIDCLEPASNEKLLIQWFALLEQEHFINEVEPTELIVLKKALKYLLNRCYEMNDGDEVKTIRYNPRSEEIELTFIKNDGQRYKMPLSSLSDGYRNTFGLVADLIQRACLLNPQLGEDVLSQITGVVLIDEIDQHLHPRWQRHIVIDLKELFPKVQFIVTTHSPNILATIKKESVIILGDSESQEEASFTYGRDVNNILCDIMNVPERLPIIQLKIDKLYIELENENYEQIEVLLKELENILGADDPELIKFRTMLEFERED